MTEKPPKKGLAEPEVQHRHKDDGATDSEWDAWFKRNGKALNASIRKAREEYARGHYYGVDEVMKRVRTEIKRVAKKD